MMDTPQDEYVKNPGACPCCQSTDIGGGFINVDGGTVTQSVGCNECGAEWSDIYELNRYEITEQPND